jgi:hypothetical protein
MSGLPLREGIAGGVRKGREGPIGDVALNRFVHHVWRSFPAPTQHASYTKTVVSPCLACAMSPWCIHALASLELFGSRLRPSLYVAMDWPE